MARFTGPKFKLSRRAGVNVTGTTSQRLEQVLQIPPGQHQRHVQEVTRGVIASWLERDGASGLSNSTPGSGA